MQEQEQEDQRELWPLRFSAACLAIGAAVYLQPTIELAGFKIRASLSDIVLAAMLVWAASMALTRRVAVPVGIAVSAAALLAVFAIGWTRSTLEFGAPTAWSTNKLAGLPVLYSYVFVGAMFALFGGMRAVWPFIAGYLGAGALITVWRVLTTIYLLATGGWVDTENDRFYGAIDDANALALAFVLAIALIVALRNEINARFGKGATAVLLGIHLVGLVLTVSASGWIGLLIVLGLLVLLRTLQLEPRAWKGLAIALPIAVAGLTILNPLNVTRVMGKLPQTAAILLPKDGGLGIGRDATMNARDYCRRVSEEAHKRLNPTIAGRVALNCFGFELWRNAPVLGAGLGAFVGRSLRDGPVLPDYPDGRLHNTYFWLLAELGIVGLLCFVALMGSVLVRIVRHAGRGSGAKHGMAAAIVAFLAAWLTMSLANELMYQRIPWLALGLALGLALREAEATEAQASE